MATTLQLIPGGDNVVTLSAALQNHNDWSGETPARPQTTLSVEDHKKRIFVNKSRRQPLSPILWRHLSWQTELCGELVPSIKHYLSV